MTEHLQQELVCKNCGHQFTDSFCNKCGQKDAHRITIGHVFHDLVHVFLHADKGVLAFIPRLVLKPGIVAREFIEGKRKIFNPFQYLIISVGIVLFLLAKSDFYETMRHYNNQQSSRLPDYFARGISDFNGFVQQYANAITFLSLPIYALFSWLFFKKKRVNYAEHFTLQVFSMSQINTVNIIVLLACLLFKVQGFYTLYFTLILTVICLTFIYRQFFRLKWLTAFWKGLIVYVSAYIVQFILMGIGLVIYLLILRSRR